MKCQNCKEELKRNPSSETYKCTNDECRMSELGYLEPSYFGPQWISVEDELPKDFHVLALSPSNQVYSCSYYVNENYFVPYHHLSAESPVACTHWMPLP